MSDTPTTSPTEIPPTNRNGLLVASAILALVCIVSLVAWSTLDATFHVAVWMANVNIGLTPFLPNSPEFDELGLTDMIIEAVTQWDSLGKRILAIHALTFAAFVGTAILVVAAIRRRTKATIVTAIGILTCWIMMFALRSPTHQWLVERQATEILPQFEAAASDLIANWPTKPTVIGVGVEVIVDPDCWPDVLVVKNTNGYSAMNGFGHTIDRSKDGVIRFSLSPASAYSIEFHPLASQPRSFVGGFGNPSPQVASFTMLKPQWYLVCYGE